MSSWPQLWKSKLFSTHAPSHTCVRVHGWYQVTSYAFPSPYWTQNFELTQQPLSWCWKGWWRCWNWVRGFHQMSQAFEHYSGPILGMLEERMPSGAEGGTLTSSWPHLSLTSNSWWCCDYAFCRSTSQLLETSLSQGSSDWKRWQDQRNYFASS